MKATDLIKELKEELLVEGIQSRIVPISHWDEIRNEIEQVLEGISDQGILSYIRSYYDFDIEKGIENPRSIIIMGIPSPTIRFRFVFNGKEIEAIVPHSYLDYYIASDRVVPIMEKTLGKNGHSFARLKIPAKLLAVRSGLARYGRNNITYVGSLGSHVRYMMFASDLPVEEHEWHEKRAMNMCEKCDLCLRDCPTGAIDESRFLLRAERCLTFFNEEEAEFPDWVDSSWHNCLVGCLRCQDVCPANKRSSKNVIDRGTFSADETDMLMSVAKMEDLPAELRKRVEDSGLSALYPVLPRNLRLLLAAQSDASE